MLCGGVVQHACLWSLYGDLGLRGGAIGGVLVLVGALGFTCVACTVGQPCELFWSIILMGTVFGAFATLISEDACPVTGMVRATVLDDDSTIVTTEWMRVEEAKLAKQQLALMATPECTDTCRNTCTGWCIDICNDGGLGSTGYQYNECPLGSDTSDCGCREGTTVADWLPPLEEYSWGDRSDVKAHGGLLYDSCGSTLISAGISLFCFLLLVVCAVPMQLVLLQRQAKDAAGPTNLVVSDEYGRP